MDSLGFEAAPVHPTRPGLIGVRARDLCLCGRDPTNFPKEASFEATGPSNALGGWALRKAYGKPEKVIAGHNTADEARKYRFRSIRRYMPSSSEAVPTASSPGGARPSSSLIRPSPSCCACGTRPTLAKIAGGPFTLRDCLCWFCPDFPWEKASACRGAPGTVRQTGVGLSQSLAAGDDSAALAGGGTGEETKGGALASGGVSAGEGWGRPAQEERGALGAPYTSLVDVAGASGFLGATETLPRVLVQGIEPPLDASVAQLWGALRHPDHFLYIVLRKS